MPEHLFQDSFKVIGLDPDGKKFDKVSRVVAESEDSSIYMQLDVAIEVYPMCKGEKFKMVLASTLNLDGTPDTGYFTQAARETLADQFDYVMHGKLYRISDYTPAPPPPPKKDEEDTSMEDADDDSSKKDEDTSAKNDEDTPKQDPKVEIFGSFGGLLMVLRGEPSIAGSFELDQRIFLLIRKLKV
ncbi:DNA-directed RNA polymerases II and V subunit 8A-like [Panicum virgatum]|uniref:Uncharacterized protein n=1 Tax=Panicum virgatum TaxID=38727 RepID=A0A8T0MBC6_PANVG|nr:DNA-directed RNA polymerases II and V subunit 8A-like [Panicum virgatum]KAG2533875.1 hypothetical protein PVAP13_9NG007700 [Panicum virgatum]